MEKIIHYTIIVVYTFLLVLLAEGFEEEIIVLLPYYILLFQNKKINTHIHLKLYGMYLFITLFLLFMFSIDMVTPYMISIVFYFNIIYSLYAYNRFVYLSMLVLPYIIFLIKPYFLLWWMMIFSHTLFSYF